jgi:hypothetical protein
MVHLSSFDLYEIILRRKQKLRLRPLWLDSMPMSDFRQQESVAKRNAVFAG